MNIEQPSPTYSQTTEMPSISQVPIQQIQPQQGIPALQRSGFAFTTVPWKDPIKQSGESANSFLKRKYVYEKNVALTTGFKSQNFNLENIKSAIGNSVKKNKYFPVQEKFLEALQLINISAINSAKEKSKPTDRSKPKRVTILNLNELNSRLKGLNEYASAGVRDLYEGLMGNAATMKTNGGGISFFTKTKKVGDYTTYYRSVTRNKKKDRTGIVGLADKLALILSKIYSFFQQGKMTDKQIISYANRKVGSYAKNSYITNSFRTAHGNEFDTNINTAAIKLGDTLRTKTKESFETAKNALAV